MILLMMIPALLALLPAVFAYTNPVIYQDLADVDLRRVNSTYYMSSSTFHYSPGAPILRSYDLANWEYIGHSVPKLSQFGSQYTLPPGQVGYNGGIWASWLIFVPSQNKWFWGGCINFWQTHIFSSSGSDPTTGWSEILVIPQCYYDSGAFIDTDGTVYVSFRDQDKFWITQMAPNMASVVKTQIIYTPPSNMATLEGTRPYKINGNYYIFSAYPDEGAEMVLRSDSIFSTSWEIRYFLRNAVSPSPLVGNVGQGALIDTPSGGYYWMGFSWSYPNGRIPVLIPVTWSSDGWPAATLANGVIASSYPDVLTPHPVDNQLTGVDKFVGPTLGPQWEWNHDPDTTNLTISNGLTLKVATITNDLNLARNTLTHRQLGPISTATIRMTTSAMRDGDRAGLALLRDYTAYIGVWRTGNTYTINMVNGIAIANSGSTLSTGSTAASVSVTATTLWFRTISDTTAAVNSARFWYSTNGQTFTQLGPAWSTNTTFPFFTGQRFAIFNFGTLSSGGSVRVADFELAAGSYTGAAL